MSGFAQKFQPAALAAISPSLKPHWKIAAVLALAAILSPAHAQDSGAGRFVMEKTGEGLVRLDTQTGELSICSEHNGRIDCMLADDERQSVNARISELEDRIAALEARIETRDEKSGNPLAAVPLKPKLNDLPSDAELDQVFNMMERFMHRFVDIFKDLDRKIEKDDNPLDPLPEKT